MLSVSSQMSKPNKLLSNFLDNDIQYNTTILQPLYRQSVSQQSQLRTGIFCWSNVLLPVCPCWLQLAHWIWNREKMLEFFSVTGSENSIRQSYVEWNTKQTFHAQQVRSRSVPGLLLATAVATSLAVLTSSPAPLFSRCSEPPSALSLVGATSHWCIGGLHTITNPVQHNVRTHTHTLNRFTALFPGPAGWVGARREPLDFMVQGKINRGRHTDNPSWRNSIRTNHRPPTPSPIFYRLDALPVAQPTVSKHWRQCSIT